MSEETMARLPQEEAGGADLFKSLMVFPLVSKKQLWNCLSRTQISID